MSYRNFCSLSNYLGIDKGDRSKKEGLNGGEFHV